MVSKLSREEKTKAKTGLAQDVDSLVDQLVIMDINQEGMSLSHVVEFIQLMLKKRVYVFGL